MPESQFKLSAFTFAVTEDCNLRCGHCYQERSSVQLAQKSASRTVDFFQPYFERECHLKFFGGEPLLAFARIRQIVDRLKKNDPGGNGKLRYALTSNGRLIDDEILEFLEEHCFELLLSVNGSPAWFFSLIDVILRRPRLTLAVNAVFTPATVHRLTNRISGLVSGGVSEVLISFSPLRPWGAAALRQLEDRLGQLADSLRPFHRRTGRIPVPIFRPDPHQGIFACTAGHDRLFLAANGKIWGCSLFNDYFKIRPATAGYREFCFGSLADFKRYPQAAGKKKSHYRKLRQDFFSSGESGCALCPELEECRVCPVSAAFASGELGRIPDWLCRLQQIKIHARRRFLESSGQAPDRNSA